MLQSYKWLQNRREHIAKENQSMISGESNGVHLSTSCAVEINYLSEEWKAGLK